MLELKEFFAMGGYAFYVWSSYALTGVLLIGIAVWSAKQHKMVQQQTFARALQSKRKDDT
ncbi:MAG: heme exporter protein CcmD [Granulosicoccus sp.]